MGVGRQGWRSATPEVLTLHRLQRPTVHGARSVVVRNPFKIHLVVINGKCWISYYMKLYGNLIGTIIYLFEGLNSFNLISGFVIYRLALASLWVGFP